MHAGVAATERPFHLAVNCHRDCTNRYDSIKLVATVGSSARDFPNVELNVINVDEQIYFFVDEVLDVDMSFAFVDLDNFR